MSVISASSAGVKDMADGSLRITFEFEPRHAADAFALFGPRGRSVAIAALVDGHGAVTDEQSDMGNPITQRNQRLGDLAWRAVQWCKDPEFRAWLRVHRDFANELTEDAASEVIKSWCNVGSRKDLDVNAEAAKRFHQLIRGPYQKHLLARGAN